MRSQLTNADISNINGGGWVAEYCYYKNGDMAYRTVQTNQTDFTYSGNQMIQAGSNNLSYDENGQLKTGLGTLFDWNWDNKLRSAEKGPTSISLKYDPSGNRIYKNSNETGSRRYIVDVVGDLPAILLELDPDDNMAVKKTYIYANSQIIAQHDGNTTDPRYFYLHDRLGSVRLIINSAGDVNNTYTYNPFGEIFPTETAENISNPFKFSGQFFDEEIDEYYLRARQYDPYIARFTSRDPVFGKFEEPMSFHKYLYCLNNPINMIDPLGLDAYLFLDPTGGPDWGRDLGHITVGVDSKDGGMDVRYAAYGRLKPLHHFSSLQPKQAIIDAATDFSDIFVTFKNKAYNKNTSSDSRIRSYLHKGIRPYWDTRNILYCSTYGKAALEYGGYDMGYNIIGLNTGITPKTLMAAAIERSTEDKNIEASPEALSWYVTEFAWWLY